jgi:hypothetical protein
MDLWSSVLPRKSKTDPRVSSLFVSGNVDKKTVMHLFTYIMREHYLTVLTLAPFIILPLLMLSISVTVYPTPTFSISISNIWYFTLFVGYVSFLFIKAHKLWRKYRKHDKSSNKDVTDADWYPKLINDMKFNARIQRDIAEFTLSKDFDGYDPTDTESLARFRPVQQNTECAFAKTAKIWGSRDWNPNLSLEENVKSSIPALIQFLTVGERDQLDGFLFELREPGWAPSEGTQQPKYDRKIELAQFGDKVRRCLKTISDYDPGRMHAMNRPHIGRKGWFFQFNRYPIFLTTFAPIYPESHSRYAFDAPKDSCFVLLQPEYSFLYHDLDPDTPHTEWENPKTVRDRIRIAYKKAGRAYDIPPTVSYPPAHHIVKPYPVDTGREEEVVEWWIPPKEQIY